MMPSLRYGAIPQVSPELGGKVPMAAVLVPPTVDSSQEGEAWHLYSMSLAAHGSAALTPLPAPVQPRPASLRQTLERDRLVARERRLLVVLQALDERSSGYSHRMTGVPGPLREAIAGFRRELGDVRRRLRDLDR